MSEAKKILISFIRNGKFDEIEMTHICCSRDRGPFSTRLCQKPSISGEDIDEILDEESDFVEILEK